MAIYCYKNYFHNLTDNNICLFVTYQNTARLPNSETVKIWKVDTLLYYIDYFLMLNWIPGPMCTKKYCLVLIAKTHIEKRSVKVKTHSQHIKSGYNISDLINAHE